MTAAAQSATRDAFGDALLELAREDPNVVALDCDLGRSTRSFGITGVDPDRFFDLGIAEQDMISTAAGMASLGKTVFANSFAVFITGRAFDQIRQQVALPQANVKICGSSAGLTQGPDGATHQSVLDVALMRTLPNMCVVVPADPAQTRAAVRAAYEHAGPVYLRLSRYAAGDFLPAGAELTLGKTRIIREGEDVALLACGPVLRNVILAADALRARGLEAAVVNCHTIKPFDEEAVEALAGRFRHLVTVEEHSIYGGLGSAAAEVLAELPGAARTAALHRLGVRDTFGESGTADELLALHGLDPDGIVRSVLDLLK